MIIDLNQSGKKSEDRSCSSGDVHVNITPKNINSDTPLTLPSDFKPTEGKIIKRVFFTRTEFRIYPNGQIYIDKTQQWFDKTSYQVKKKVKKKAAKVAEVKGEGEEVY